MQHAKICFRLIHATVALAGALLLVCMLAHVQSAFAQQTSNTDPVAPAAVRFAEQAFPALADSFEVPGAVLAVVGRGGTLGLKAYGYANLSTQQPADPEQTLFRVASVSKPVTATTILAFWVYT